MEPIPKKRSTTWAVSLLYSLGSGLLLWTAFPPLNIWPLAWVALVRWIWLIGRAQPLARGDYLAIWCGGFVHWLLMLQGIRLANPLLYGGWITLSAYLACYAPLFVGLARVAARPCSGAGWRLPVVVATPVVWVGLEWFRGYFVTGFSAGLLAHSQTAWPALLQIADFSGALGVSFLIAGTNAAIAQLLPSGTGQCGDRRAWIWPPLAATGVGLALWYGGRRLQEVPPDADKPPLRVALIQGSHGVRLEMTTEEYDLRMREQVELSRQAAEQDAELDLIIWAESMFVFPDLDLVEPVYIPGDLGISPAEALERRELFKSQAAAAAEMWNAPRQGDKSARKTAFIFGGNTIELGPNGDRQFNSAFLVDSQGKMMKRYDKTHAVMFGEYIPLAKQLAPGLTRRWGLPRMEEGAGPRVFAVAGWRLAPNICFESTVPHLIRGQVLVLDRNAQPPDLLINLTNDGWFWGSSILDLHLQCAVFRAIENRRPVLIAANTGLTAQIDGSGRILRQAPRGEPRALAVSVSADGRRAWAWNVDALGLCCAIVCGGLAAISGYRRFTGTIPPADC